MKRPDLAAQATGSTSGITTGAGVANAKGSALPSGHVLVFKPDGSKQCEAGSGVSLADMEKELQGITVYNRTGKSDGRMHPMVCGSATGRINTYEIDETSLKEAEKRGFARL